MKAFSFAGTAVSLALYLIGGAGYLACSFWGGVWETILSVLGTALAAGLTLLGILAAVVCFVASCIIGTVTLIYSGLYYLAVAVIAALRWVFEGFTYQPDRF